MYDDRIDFVSAYCDRWCERCPFTQRCSAFVAMAAVAMCEDDKEGLELAFGRAPDDDGVVPSPPDWLNDLEDVILSDREADAWAERCQQRRARINAMPIVQLADALMRLAYEWLRANPQVGDTQDALVREAFEVANYDVILIRAKLHRALDGREIRGTDDALMNDDPVQNDWNGSAKVALISIERSATAWAVLASATGQEAPAVVAGQLHDLGAHVEREFPDVRRFKRPGFDAG